MEISFSRVARDVLDIEDILNKILSYNINIKQLKLKAFVQVWENTSCGFEGIGCSKITEQMTYVVYNSLLNKYYVFFGNRFAYKVIGNENFLNDLALCNLKGMSSYKNFYVEFDD